MTESFCYFGSPYNQSHGIYKLERHFCLDQGNLEIAHEDHFSVRYDVFRWQLCQNKFYQRNQAIDDYSAFASIDMLSA